MNLGHANDEIKYDETIAGIARYVVILDGEPTMYVLCDSSDADKTIVVSRPGDLNLALSTKGQFSVITKLLEGPDGAPLGTETRVDEKSVYAYVVPRLHVLLGRLLRAA
jgi:hypothetical protein